MSGILNLYILISFTLDIFILYNFIIIHLLTNSPYIYLIVGILIIAVRLSQKNNKKTIDLKESSPDSKVNEVISQIDHSSLIEHSQRNLSVSKEIVKTIDDLNFVLKSNNLDKSGNYEIEFVNYEKKIFDFKRQSTHIKLTGNDKSTKIDHIVWSDRYEYGQYGHNEEIVTTFFDRLKINLEK